MSALPYTFVETKHLIRDEYEQSGVECSSRKAHRLARALHSMIESGINFWSAEDPELVKDPTGREAIRRVMSKMEVAAA